MEKTHTRHTKTDKSKSDNFDDSAEDRIREKTYTTKQIDTSISILDSPENGVVLDSLLFLSKYADLKIANLTYLQQKGLTTKILNLLDRNVCIVRLSLRLLAQLLDKTPIIAELDQDIYNDKILQICDLYIHTNDQLVKEFSVEVLAKIAKSCRITCLILTADLFQPIFETIRVSKNITLLTSVIRFLNNLLDSPAALGVLVTAPNQEIGTIMHQLSNPNETIAKTAYEIIIKLTSKDICAFQQMFRENQLVEKMIEVIMDPVKASFHELALEVIRNCSNSEETSTYFVKSIRFLALCQFVKECDEEFLRNCADIFEKLSGIPSIKQTLYDLSAEDAMIYLLRSTQKEVLNKGCKAITNMTAHKYCCETMATPTVMKALIDILQRKDTVDPQNEVALETIYSFFVRTIKALPMLYYHKIIPILLKYFAKGSNLSEESYLRVIDMLYKYSLISEYQHSVIGETFFEKLLCNLEGHSDDLAALSLEILVHFIGNNTFNKIFLTNFGTNMILNRLRQTENIKLMKYLLLFIHSAMLVDDLSIEFLKCGLMSVLKNIPEHYLVSAPIVDTIKTLAYNVHLPMKFHKTGKLDLANKLGNKFYIVKGRMWGTFPFIEVIQAQKVCPMSILYIVDYTYEVRKLSSKPKLRLSQSFESQNKNDEYPKFGNLNCTVPLDIHLPYYINFVEKNIKGEWTMARKIEFLAEYVDELLCGHKENETMSAKQHNFQVHLESLKYKLGTSVIPIGYLRLGFHCERALLFKAIADRVDIPCTLQYNTKVYWNEVALLEDTERGTILKFYLVDLMNNIGKLLAVGSKEANRCLREPIL